jgi:predicted Ser/Thr protein kinase
MSSSASKIFLAAARHRYGYPAAISVGSLLIASSGEESEKKRHTKTTTTMTTMNNFHGFQTNHTDDFFSSPREIGRVVSELCIPDVMIPLPSLVWPSVTHCDFFAVNPRQSIRRRRTLKRLQETKTREKMEHKYKVQWNRPLGEGGFGAVYLATNKKTGEMVAVKKISKQYTNDTSFQQEMNAFHQIRRNGNHPNICGLRENFDEGKYFYLVMDLISGGEVFDRLIEAGAYSEADAARLVREVGSALAFLHGIGLVHGDLVSVNGHDDHFVLGVKSKPTDRTSCHRTYNTETGESHVLDGKPE